MIRVGSAGWSYPDWDGIVYPAGSGRGFDPLAHLASFLECIEVNASFYRIPSPRAASSWVARTADKPDFRFTAKLWRGFTHPEGPAGPEDHRPAVRAFREFLEPIRGAGRLGAVLAQFPYSLHDDAAGRARLGGILDWFGDLPLVVEVRHDSWLRGGLLEELGRRGVAFCNVDQPAVSRNIPATAHVTARIAYVRLHGRNAAAWFAEESDRDRRYDYLYAAEELSGWADRITGMAARADDVFVVANNHFRGQGVANALELKAMLGSGKPPAPRDLIAAYPRLAERTSPREVRPRRRPPDQKRLPF